jgi:hypothetical protein
MKRYILAFFVFIFLIVPINDALAKKVIFVLFDISGSTINDRNLYYQSFNATLQTIEQGDILIADEITDNPLAQSQFPIRFKSSWQENLFIFKGKLRKFQTEALKKAHHILMEEKSSSWTDIFGSMYITERVIKTYKSNKKILVIMSDMIQDSSNHHFNRIRFTPRKIEKIIASEKKRGLPDLQGVRVYVIGARARNTQRMQELRNFWIEYFNSCGAELRNENYGHGALEF